MLSLRPEPALLCCAGQVPYRVALQWQMELVQQRLGNPDLPDVLLLLEHPPVYTLGRSASPKTTPIMRPYQPTNQQTIS